MLLRNRGASAPKCQGGLEGLGSCRFRVCGLGFPDSTFWVSGFLSSGLNQAVEWFGFTDDRDACRALRGLGLCRASWACGHYGFGNSGFGCQHLRIYDVHVDIVQYCPFESRSRSKGPYKSSRNANDSLNLIVLNPTPSKCMKIRIPIIVQTINQGPFLSLNRRCGCRSPQGILGQSRMSV